MNGLTIHKQINVNFTADQWCLFTTTKDCTEAANALNDELARSFNKGLQKFEVYNNVYECMKKYSKFGACDSEPDWFLEKVLSKLYEA